MIELIVAIIAAVAAGLILDLLRKNASITIKVIKRLSKNFSGSPTDKLLIYLSSGGTGRDPIAKAITLKLIENRPLKFHLRVEGMALGPVSSTEVEWAARNAIMELYGEDLLKDYVPQTVTQKLLAESDLVLVMDHSLMMYKILPKTKTYVFKEFFGLEGDINDPYPDGKDPQTLSRYKKCATEIKSILGKNIDYLLKALQI